jgi:ABC-type amino acid transport substrate-binding protein
MLDHVTIAIDHLNPPFSLLDEWGDPRGFSVDVVRAAFASVRVEVEFRPVDGPMAQVMWVAAGRVDAAADITVTERRKAWFAFSNHYHVEELMIFGRRDGPIWPGFRHFHGRLAVKVNSYVQEFLIRHHPNIPMIAVESTEEQLEELRAGRVDGIAATRETGLALIASGRADDLIAEGTPFGPAPLALAGMPERSDELLSRFNTGLEAVQHAGRLAALQREWLHAFAHA